MAASQTRLEVKRGHDQETSRLQRAVQVVLVLLALAAVFLFLAFHGDRYLSISALKQTAWLKTSYAQHPLATILVYALFAFTFVVFSLPAASIVMILAGALFGVGVGTGVCLLAINLGAVTSLALSRFVFRDFVRRRFPRASLIIETEYAKRGASYLVSMRLIPIWPYFVTNLVFGLTSISPRKFFVVSLLSSAPAVFVYANAGRELSKVNSVSDIFTARLLIAFAALAALPLVGRFISRSAF